MALYDICYYPHAVKKASITAGRFIEARPAGSDWTDAEERAPMAVWRNVELSADKLSELKERKRRVSHHGGRGSCPSVVKVPQKNWPAVDAFAIGEA